MSNSDIIIIIIVMLLDYVNDQIVYLFYIKLYIYNIN